MSSVPMVTWRRCRFSYCCCPFYEKAAILTTKSSVSWSRNRSTFSRLSRTEKAHHEALCHKRDHCLLSSNRKSSKRESRGNNYFEKTLPCHALCSQRRIALFRTMDTREVGSSSQALSPTKAHIHLAAFASPRNNVMPILKPDMARMKSETPVELNQTVQLRLKVLEVFLFRVNEAMKFIQKPTAGRSVPRPRSKSGSKWGQLMP